MNTSPSIAQLAQALALAQGEIKNALQDSKNPHFRTKYASLSAIWNACRLALSKNGLAVIQGATEVEDHVYFETILVHSSGELISSSIKLIVDKMNMQGLGSAITYARRYQLASMVGVVNEEDDDGNAAVEYPGQQIHYNPKTEPVPKPAPVAVKPAPAASAPPTIDLLHKVQALMEKTGKTADDLKEYTKNRYGKEKSTDLTTAELTSLIAALEKNVVPN